MSESNPEYYYQYTFTCAQLDALVAMLNELPFNGFEEVDHKHVHAFVDAQNVNEDFLIRMQDIGKLIPFEYVEQRIEMQNWNANWEEDFEPVVVDDFCLVRADFHPSSNTQEHEIIITPQMSFGTGHHETTFLMIRMMRDMIFTDKKVLDFGCGTGVLAILSAKMGANDILGVDIDNNAYMNSLHNCELNQVQNIQIKHGDLSLTGDKYDVILANINRHVILDTLPSLSQKLIKGSSLLISGILHTDIPLVKEHLQKASFKVNKTQQLNDWMCIMTEKV